jgi:hypothetical protein
MKKKIIFHGKRADAIVKSMLQHSRSSSSKKELTDINALADEYLRLAYHGMRQKKNRLMLMSSLILIIQFQVKRDTAGYRPCDPEFNYQCFLCCI